MVCDRGGDTFEELEHEQRSGRRLVIRAQHDRQILVGHEGASDIQYLQSTWHRQPAMGSFTLDVPAAPGRAARKAKLCVSSAAVRLLPPQRPRGDHSQQPLPLWVVREDWSIHEFFLALARLGGHQNRKGDKPPGGLVLWRGWSALQLLAAGAQGERLRQKLGIN